MSMDDDLDWVKHVERYPVGITHPLKPKTDAQLRLELKRLNAALRYGKIIGTERNFTVAKLGKKEIIAEYLVYHVGFKYKPSGK